MYGERNLVCDIVETIQNIDHNLIKVDIKIVQLLSLK